jgi:hypothetical protein
MARTATAHALAHAYLFTDSPFVPAQTAPIETPESIFDTSRSARFTANELKREELAIQTAALRIATRAALEARTKEPVFGPQLPGTPPPVKCRCEQDVLARQLYFAIEYGTMDAEPPAEWILAHVAEVEDACPAQAHYQSILLDEALVRDVTLDVDDPDEAERRFYDMVNDDHQLYLRRTEEGGRFLDRSGPGSHRNASDSFVDTLDGLHADRDREDYTTRIRAFEMAKKRELRDEMIARNLDPRSEAAWVAKCIGFKRADAIRDHEQDVARAEKLARTEGAYVAAPPLVSETQIRLRAYSYCLDFLRRGKKGGPAEALAATVRWTYTDEVKRQIEDANVAHELAVEAAARIAAQYDGLDDDEG